MRKILFRAKAINRDERYETRTKYKNGDWVYGLVSKLGSEKYGIPMEMTNTDGISGIDVDRKTIGQYTGLKDKNGTRIFEGDIVRGDSKYFTYNHPYGTIVYDGGEFLIAFDEAFEDIENLGAWANDIEVIGNIHDNPELLEGRG